jgi:hypothetical protein
MKDIKQIAPERFDNLTIYIQTLIALNNQFSILRSVRANIHNQREKLPEISYNMTEILLKIHNLIPLKVNLKKSKLSESELTVEFMELKEQLFYKDVKIDYLTDQLQRISKKHKAFFFFNHFARNVLLHHKHGIRQVGSTALDTMLTSLDFRLNITKHISKAIGFFNITFVKKEVDTDKIIINRYLMNQIKIESLVDSYYMEMTLSYRLINQITNEINDAFIFCLNKLEKDLMIIQEDSIFDYPVKYYLLNIKYWKKALLNSCNKLVI